MIKLLKLYDGENYYQKNGKCVHTKYVVFSNEKNGINREFFIYEKEIENIIKEYYNNNACIKTALTGKEYFSKDIFIQALQCKFSISVSANTIEFRINTNN